MFRGVQRRALDHWQAWSWLRQHDERAYSFVDATSFMVMRSERITEALAFDGGFSAAGFIEVRPWSSSVTNVHRDLVDAQGVAIRDLDTRVPASVVGREQSRHPRPLTPSRS